MLRITGGEFRGRSIQTPKGDRTRPTQARLRQALFNSIQTRIGDAKVLDLFAGSGALGFEALSRGAASVVFAEQAKPALRLIEKNAQDLKVSDRIEMISDPIEKTAGPFWARLLKHGPFDIVLADPPYDAGWETVLLSQAPWQKLLSPGGLFCLEWGSVKSEIEELPDPVPFLVKVREKNYGDSVLSSYEMTRTGEASPRV